MANQWQKKLYKTAKMDFSNQKLPWKKPYLSKPKDDDLGKQWCVDYGIWSFDKNRVVRKRYVLVGETVEDRLQAAADAIDEINALISNGTAYVGKMPADFKLKPAPVAVDPDQPAGLVVSPTTPISTAIQDYINYTKAALSANTFKTYRTAVHSLEKYLERHRRTRMTLGSFTTADAVEFLNELITVEKHSNRTRNNIKGHICTFFNHYIGLDKTKKLKKNGNPFSDEDIKKLPQIQNKHQSYSLPQQAEYRTLCQTTGQEYLFTFCRWMYYTLMRPHEELRRLRVRDVRMKMIYVTGNSAKTNDGDYVDIPLPLEQLIQAQKIRDYPGHYFVFSKDGQPGPVMVGNKFFYRRHVKIVEAMNLVGSGHDMYSWKHTGAIALWNVTKDIDLVRSQARHSDIKQTIEYLRDLGIRLAEDDKIHRFPVL